MCRISAVLVVATLSLGPSTAPTMAAEVPLEAGYVVRWGSVEIGRFGFELRRTGDRYHLAYQTRTSGPLGWFVDLESDGWASGRLSDGTDGAGSAVEAEHFRGRSRWRDGGGHWRVSFDADGKATEVEVDAATRADREPVPEALRRGPDPLSLMLETMRAAAAGDRFEGQSFDGRRAVRVSLACAPERSTIQPVALGPAIREALVCDAEGEMLAGRSERWSNDDDARDQERPPVRVWLVPEVGGMPHWPVRIEAETRWGGVSVELETFIDPDA